ncbi:MAG: ABC transporter permease [Ginsengibacter sp.]
MFKNYFKTAWRNLIKSKVSSFINIFGLAVGMAVVLLIGLWVSYEINFDDFNANKKNIAIIMKKTFFNNEKSVQEGLMLPLYDELKANYPEVKHITRVDWGDDHSLKTGDNKFNKKGLFADADFLKMFSFHLIKSNENSVLKDPYSIVLTQTTANVIFGKENPIGKVITVDNQFDVAVTGIVKDVPKNSTIQFDFLMPYELYILSDERVKNSRTVWLNRNFVRNYVELRDGVSMEAFTKRIEHIIQRKVNDPKQGTLFVHPMEKWHLYSDFKEWENTGGRIEYVRLFGIIGLLVLIIACINFMNLSTARSGKRAKEVGIRKAVGSERKQLITQFMGESLLTSFVAFLISLLIVKLCLPLLSNIGFNDITLDLTSFSLLSTAITGCIITGLLAGSYPALYLSGLSPIKVLKKTFQAGRAGDLPRKILVVTQFTFSIALIIGTIIVFQQIQYAKERALGYNPDNMLTINISSDLIKNFNALKQDLLATDYVDAVSKSSSPMTGIYNKRDDFSWAGKDPDNRPLIATIMVDLDYDKAAGIKMKEGRFFSKQFLTDSNGVILNETAAKLIGFKHPVGKTMQLGDETLNIIGVANNVVMDDPFKLVMPGVMLYNSLFVREVLIRLKASADVRKALASIQSVVEKYNPSYPFDYHFVDEEFNNKFRDENQVGKLSSIFAALAIFISCLGLFGLASFMVERRTKEIGVRKVLGASVPQLWLLLSKDFVFLIIISCIIASPIAFYFLQNWLAKYEYHIEISLLVFFAAAAIAIAVALATITFQAIKAAIANPVKSLRTE